MILPMPCEGSMVFRRVEIPVAGPLDDIPITLGKMAVNGALWNTVIPRLSPVALLKRPKIKAVII